MVSLVFGFGIVNEDYGVVLLVVELQCVVLVGLGMFVVMVLVECVRCLCCCMVSISSF